MSMNIIAKVVSGGKTYGAEVETADGGYKQELVGADGLGETIPPESTNLEIAFPIDASALKGLFLYCTGVDLVLKTNDSGTPDHTFNLTAGKGAHWHADSPFANPLGSTDVTTIFVTNASSTTAAKLFVIADSNPTP